MNEKPPSQRKRHHLNLYLTDDDKRLLDKVMNSHRELPLDRMFIYALKKIYNNTNFPQDYNALIIAFLSERQAILTEEIQNLKQLLNQKQLDLNDITEKINEMMEGDKDDTDN